MKVKVEFTITGSYIIDDKIVEELLEDSGVNENDVHSVLDEVKEVEKDSGPSELLDRAGGEYKVELATSLVA